MRIVFSGASPITVMAAQALTKKHEVVIIEIDKEKIDELSEEMDCSFLYGDSGKPAILKEVNPQSCDFLFCLANNDQANIITSLLGRSLGFKRVVTSIEDPELENMCREIGLEDIIIPARTVSHHLENMIRGLDDIELSSVLKHGAQMFTFIASKQEAVSVAELDLPKSAKIIFYYRDEKFYLADEKTRFKKKDEIVILTDTNTLPELNKRYIPKQTEGRK